MRNQQGAQAPSFDKPPYEANWIIDQAQNPESVLDRHRRNAANPAVHETFRRALQEKTDREGVIHVDPATGYRARFKPQTSKAPAREQSGDQAGA